MTRLPALDRCDSSRSFCRWIFHESVRWGPINHVQNIGKLTSSPFSPLPRASLIQSVRVTWTTFLVCFTIRLHPNWSHSAMWRAEKFSVFRAYFSLFCAFSICMKDFFYLLPVSPPFFGSFDYKINKQSKNSIERISASRAIWCKHHKSEKRATRRVWGSWWKFFIRPAPVARSRMAQSMLNKEKTFNIDERHQTRRRDRQSPASHAHCLRLRGFVFRRQGDGYIIQ